MHYPLNARRHTFARLQIEKINPKQKTLRAATGASLILLALGCSPNGEDLDAEDIDALMPLSGLSSSDLPASPTNSHADDDDAARLGQRLFFDQRMSATGDIACASCHDPDHAWSEPRAVSTGAFGRVGNRHAPTLWNAGMSQFFFWDGRADSLWSQPLQAIEGEAEMDFTRLEVAHFVVQFHRAEYESVFGPLPNVGGMPARGKPGDASWNNLSGQGRDSAQRIFANVGKALEAFQRRLICSDTRFDQFMAEDVDLSEREQRGARQFVRGGCIDCHSGPTLSDDGFHNIGIDHRGDVDNGRADAIEGLMASPFNGMGAYSDDTNAGQALLATIAQETRQLGSFKTPTLRGVGQRSHFGHLGTLRTLRDMIDHYDRNRGNARFAGSLDPEMDDVDVRSERDMEAFLRTLDCPPLATELRGPPPPFDG